MHIEFCDLLKNSLLSQIVPYLRRIVSIQTKSAQGISRTVENLYDNQGRSLGDLFTMNDLQAAYDVVNYATEMQDQGVDWRSDKGLVNQFESAQQTIQSAQTQLQASGYQSSQISQEALSVTMGSLEKTVGRTTEYSDHNRGNSEKMTDFIRDVKKVKSHSGNDSKPNYPRTIQVKSNPRIHGRSGSRGYGPNRNRGMKGKKR